MNKITYYDFTNIIYSGLFINGFLKNEDEYDYRFVVSNQMPPEFEDLNQDVLHYTQQPYSILRYEGKEQFLFCIDAGDMNGSESTVEYYAPYLERCQYFFKVNYNADVIAQTDLLNRYASKIKPVPIVYPIALSRPWLLRPRFGGPGWSLAAIKRRSKDLLKTVRLNNYRKLRHIDEDLDLFFTISLYKDPMYEEVNQKRRILVDLINDKMKKYNILAGYICLDNESSADCGPNQIQAMRHSDVLRHYARSRVGLYVRGLHGCLSYKFGELMALGTPIAGETILNNRANMYTYDHFEEQFAYDDPEELVDRTVYLLEHPRYLEELKRANIETFENHFTPKPVVKSILDQMDLS
jgi:hypothetical protein